MQTSDLFKTSIYDVAPNEIAPLVCDPWVATSTLQKAIRRGEVTTAQRAALTCLEGGRDVWRRLAIIAFEDVGIGSEEAVSEVITTIAELKRDQRKDAGLLIHLVRCLAEASKDRSAEHLITAASHGPQYADVREACGISSQPHCLAMVGDRELALSMRSVAAWYASGIGHGFKVDRERAQIEALAEYYCQLGATERLVKAMVDAARLTREAIVTLVPLLQVEARKHPQEILRQRTPDYISLNGVPSYALDKHTRAGQRAIQILIREDPDLQRTLEKLSPDYRWRAVAFMAAFYTDAVCTARRLIWTHSEAIEKLGRSVDFCRVGISSIDVDPLLKIMESRLERLNEIRSSLMSNVL